MTQKFSGPSLQIRGTKTLTFWPLFHEFHTWHRISPERNVASTNQNASVNLQCVPYFPWRQCFYQQRLQEASGNKGLKWRVVRELLHADERKSYSSHEASTLCSSFSVFLTDKQDCISDIIRKRLTSTPAMVHPPVPRICSSTLSTLETVTVDEVTRVIRLLPQKT